jgi:hypothetical protein
MRNLIAAEKGEVEEIPDEPPALHHDAHYAIRTWIERRLHHIYPEPGGLMDQDEELMADWDTLNIIYIRAGSGAFSAPPLPEDAPDWQGLMKD